MKECYTVYIKHEYILLKTNKITGDNDKSCVKFYDYKKS